MHGAIALARVIPEEIGSKLRLDRIVGRLRPVVHELIVHDASVLRIRIDIEIRAHLPRDDPA